MPVGTFVLASCSLSAALLAAACHHSPANGGGVAPVPTANLAPTDSVSGAVIAITAGDGGAEVTINRGTNDALSTGRQGAIDGLANGTFTLARCKARTCTATVAASVSEVKASSMKFSIK